jgi:hypothetical protein
MTTQLNDAARHLADCMADGRYHDEALKAYRAVLANDKLRELSDEQHELLQSAGRAAVLPAGANVYVDLVPAIERMRSALDIVRTSHSFNEARLSPMQMHELAWNAMGLSK